jgi:hypothetical protein
MISSQQANYDATIDYQNNPQGENRQRTLPVDSFRPNPWGLYQVHGNVWEWTEDCFFNGYAGAPSDGSAWMAGDCTRHVIRGGAFFSGPYVLRAAARAWNGQWNGGRGQGFRVARTLADDSGNVSSCPDISGSWHWFNGGTVYILPNGTMGRAGTWTCSSDTFVLKWNRGGYIDQLSLSADGKHLSGTNSFGATVWGDRN